MKKYVVGMALLFSLVFLFTQGYEWNWVTNAGGTGAEYGSGIVTDSLENQYVTGSFDGSINLGSITLSSNGGRDIFVAKLDSGGNFIWAVSAGGTGNDFAYAIALDASDNLYLSGRFYSTANFGSLSLTSSGDYDIFTAKLTNNGIFLWVVGAGGTGSDSASSIALDTSVNIYLTGRFENTATFGNHILISSGGSDIFAAKLDSNGNFLWAVKAGGTELDERGTGVAVDSADNIYLTGYFYGTADFGTIQITSNGSRDIFVAGLNSSGSFLWALRAGGVNEYDWGSGIAVDDADNVYITGFFDYTAYFGSYQLISNGYHDIFAAKLDSDGNFLWATKAGGIGGDQAWGIAVDTDANVYLTGFFYGSASFGTHTVNGYGYFDIFAAKLDSDGNWLCALSAGSVNDQDIGYGIAVDASANAYLTGCYEGTATFGLFTQTNAGDTDIFVAKISPNVLADDEFAPAISGSSCLTGAYPNPFNSEIAILFKLDRAQIVQADIYNLKGQLIKTLCNGLKSAGDQHLVWSGDDNRGQPVSSGVYFVKLQTGGSVSIMKLVLVK